ncbi:MAG: hypothetical protein M1838_001160 [Thelocarpon superellum]|nr:MAG: hypothetical protein M1838_001160 [Thelocarpon superellum]
MSAEPTLPPPLSPTGASSRELRKRAREYIPSSSSDPPLFSSDEAAPTADDDGIGGRQSKRRYRGVETPATLADRTIRTCLEEGNELVDLSNLRLATLSTSTIRPLRYMTKHPKIDHLPPSQESYTPLVPSIRLFLSGNLLHSVPGEIFNIHNLTVLSLRNNQLTELPSGIARLTNLVELNVGGNKLSWLPYELLGLVRPHGRLRTLSIYPNPLLEVDGILPEMRPIVVERGRPVSTSSVEQSHDRDLEAWPQHVGELHAPDPL